MAALPEAEREMLWRWIALTNRGGEIDRLTRAQLRPAIDASDDFAVANAASFNSALPQPARDELTAAEKALLLMYVLRRRALMKPSAELSDEERDNIVREAIAKNPNSGFTTLEEADVRPAVDGADGWAVDNAQAFNAVLPQPARSVMTNADKVNMFSLVVEWRWRTGA